MSTQSRFDIWSNRNRQANGDSDIAISQDINIPRTSKESEFETIKSQITDAEKIRMRELLYLSKSQLEFISRMESEGINPTYLVAFDIVTEEDLNSYFSLKDRGIDTFSLQKESNVKKVDGGYYREILTAKKEMPPLLNIKGDNIQKTLNKEEYIRDVVSISPEQKEPENKALRDVPSIAIDLEELDNAIMEEKIEEAKDWKQLFSKIKEQYKEEEAVSDSTLLIATDENTRNVYILSEEFVTPIIEGYNFIFIKTPENFSRFAVNKNNLLILTKNVPKYLLENFAEWIKGVIEKGDNFRIATLSTSKLSHSIIQGTLLKLDKKSLDDFYNEHKTEDYLGEAVGSFTNLTSIIEDDVDEK